MAKKWIAKATYNDGTYIRRAFNYTEQGNAALEIERQYILESWLMDQHDGINWYSVDFQEE